MKKFVLLFVSMMLSMALLAGCGGEATVEPTPTGAPTADSVTVSTEAPAEEPTEAPATEPNEEPAAEPNEEPAAEPTEAPAEDEEDIVYEGDASSYYIDVVYAEQIGRYYTALTEKWDEEECAANGVSEVIPAYYGGNPLENVGFGFVDLDNDGRWELIIGAIQDAEDCPAVFEIWTLVDDQPVMLAQASARIQYTLQYLEEDLAWYVVNERPDEDETSISCRGTYYLMLIEGKFEVVQGIIFNSAADKQNPWFMTYDLDWDVSNDEPIDEDMAYAILEANRNSYIALEYFPYIFYK